MGTYTEDDLRPDEFECPNCGERVNEDLIVCPYCGLHFYPDELTAPTQFAGQGRQQRVQVCARA